MNVFEMLMKSAGLDPQQISAIATGIADTVMQINDRLARIETALNIQHGVTNDERHEQSAITNSGDHAE